MQKVIKIITRAVLFVSTPICILLITLAWFGLCDVETIFGTVHIEQMMINLTQSVGGMDTSVFSEMFIACSWKFAIIVAVYVFSRYVLKKISLGKLSKRITSMILLCVMILVISLQCIQIEATYGVIKYLTREASPTEFFERYYVDGEQLVYDAPEVKRNLIYIISESLETTYLSVEVGGYEGESLMPYLEAICREETVFSNGTGMQGARSIHGTEWTAAGIMAQTSGTPLKAAVGQNTYGVDGIFAPGVYSIGEILGEMGYKNYFRMGSLATFANRDVYLKTNGDYQIYDLQYMIDTGVYEEGYKVWWGYEDIELFHYAKEDLLRIAEEEEGFNYTLLTADTHFPSGHICELCEEETQRQYANVILCQDRQITEFIEWIKEQDFYENTTIVVAGDHLSMDTIYFEEFEEDIVRTPFHVFINANAEKESELPRSFTVMDMFPTTLAALGIEVEGDRIGLGTNLFGKRKTILEEVGYDYMQEQLEGYSVYYNEQLLQLAEETQYQIED